MYRMRLVLGALVVALVVGVSGAPISWVSIELSFLLALKVERVR